MNTSTRTQLLALTRDFYAHIATDFSRTRSGSNPGWFKCAPYINLILKSKILNPKIIDLACGNGRFATWLTQNYPDASFTYLGLDTDAKLLKIAQQSIPPNSPHSQKFQSSDIISDLPTNILHTTYHILVLFGLTHHLPGSDFRRQWFTSLAPLLKPSGLLILTFWQIDADPRFTKATRSVQTDRYHITESDLEQGDYFLGWDHAPVHRYVHIYSDQERAKILKLLNRQNLQLLHQFTADGRTDTLNHYWILQKQTTSS